MPCPARPARKVLRVEQVNDSRQNGIGQFALHQPVAKFEDGVLFKHVSIEIELGKLAAPRHVKEGFLHFRVRQAKPLPEKVNARHGFQGKGWAILTILGVARSNKCRRRSPRTCTLHLLKKLALAWVFITDLKVQNGLLRVLDFLRLDVNH